MDDFDYLGEALLVFVGSVTVLYDDARFCPAGTCALQLGQVLETAEVPGFRFRVTVETGGGAFPGVMEPFCLGETLCVSGALPCPADRPVTLEDRTAFLP